MDIYRHEEIIIHGKIILRTYIIIHCIEFVDGIIIRPSYGMISLPVAIFIGVV